MAFGVFGKLPQKRDFIALNIPRSVLEPFETWLQSAVAASRSELGAAWQELYLVSPIWRFWIGSDIFGVACAGALIPSVDKVGRFFPLAILYCADDQAGIVAPPFDPLDAWYAAIEERLLRVLQKNAEIEVDRLTNGLPLPESPAGPPAPQPAKARRGLVWQAASAGSTDLLTTLMAADYWASASARSFWWTNGGGGRGPMVYVRNALPDPFFYANMIKGSVDAGS
jgi:type VI secretion system protein ImpM